MLGPIKLFFKLKEGKTSLEKIVEDYEDDRSTIIPRPPQRAGEGGLLPTTTRPT